MSSRLRPAAWLVAGLLAASPQPGAAQAPERRTSLIQHLDTLYPLLGEAARELERAHAVRDSLARVHPSVPQDTVRVGPLRVVTYPELHDVAQEVTADVWADLGGMVAQDGVLDDFTFFFNWSRRSDRLTLQGTVFEISAPFWIPRAVLEDNAREAVGRALGAQVHGELQRWTAQWNVREPARPEAVYRELVTTASKANRACAAGDLDACWTALGLGLEEDPFPDFYTPDEAADLAVALHTRWTLEGWRFRPEDEVELGTQCSEGRESGSYESCWRFLRAFSRQVPTPLGFGARQALVWVALTRGGEGAFDRLVADPDRTPEESLLAASGASKEELARAWHSYVMANRPEVYSGLATTRWVAFFWIFFFGLMALRSSRWRLA